MALFTSTYVNKIDRKGRVSVPAPFRAGLEAEGSGLLYVTPNPVLAALDGNSEAWMEQLQARIDELDVFSEERSHLETLIFAESARLTFDPEGRVSLPRDLTERVGITDEVAFVGVGRNFQIWNPARFQEHRQRARESVARDGIALRRPGGSAPR